MHDEHDTDAETAEVSFIEDDPNSSLVDPRRYTEIVRATVETPVTITAGAAQQGAAPRPYTTRGAAADPGDARPSLQNAPTDFRLVRVRPRGRAPRPSCSSRVRGSRRSRGLSSVQIAQSRRPRCTPATLTLTAIITR